MRDAPRLNGYDVTPIYTMKTVVQQTGITPTTLRAWERRYGILQPDRSEGGYRLYSEQDIALLRWLKGQVDAGVNIGRAVALLELRRQELNAAAVAAAYNGAGLDRDTVNGLRFKSSPEPDVATLRMETRTAEAMAEELLTALLGFCETKAGTVLSEAFALYPLETVTERVIVPALLDAGERWHQRSISVVQANFASSFLRHRVSAMFTAYTQPATGPLAVTGAAPGEWHDVGILLVSLALRRQGWRVLHLGQNVPVEQLVNDLPVLKPELVCLSATTLESAEGLLAAADSIRRLPDAPPRFLFGGRAFNLYPELRDYIPDTFLGTTASEAVAALQTDS